MANVKLVGDAVIITSALRKEDLSYLAKYKPDALVLNDNMGEPVFRIAVGEPGAGEVSKYGIVFDGATRDENGYAQLTLPYVGEDGETVEEIKGAIADEIGEPLTNLIELETALPGAVEEAREARESIMNSIEII